MDYANLISKSKDLVARYTNDNTIYEETPITPEEVYVVWYCKTLQNAKVLLSTPVSDGMYYEVTYNGDKDELYFDAYRKVANVLVGGDK